MVGWALVDMKWAERGQSMVMILSALVLDVE